MTLLLLLVLLIAVEYFAAWIILRRLENRHPAFCAAAGLPSASGLSLTQRWLAMTRFIYSGACFRLDDVPLNILCATVVLGEIAILYAMLSPMDP